MSAKKPQNYINNKDFLEALKKYKLEQIEFSDSRPQTKTYDYIGKCFMQIATKLMNRPNFFNYSYKDQMISDAIMVCIQRLDNFDAEKYDNPFAYFTTLCYNGAVGRIKAEHKQRDVKAAILKNMVLDDATYDEEGNPVDVSHVIEYFDKPKEVVEKKYRRTTKAHQKKMKDLDEKIAIHEKIILDTPDYEDQIDEEEIVDESED